MKTRLFKKLSSALALCCALTALAAPASAKKVKNDRMEAYLFTYFTSGRGGEAIRYALSNDGYTWYAVNDNQPIVSSEEISSSGGLRDPYITRGADGKTFYMVVTDMHTAKNGWKPNTAMVLMKSSDLVTWQSAVVDIPATFPEFADMGNVWAPQVIYDAAAGKYMVYFSMENKPSSAVFYYAYANDDFTAFEAAPKRLFGNPNGKSSIDADIIEKDGEFHLFFKTEGSRRKGIMKAVSKSLTGGYEMMEERYLNPTPSDVEGSCVFPLIGTGEWILMYDMYRDRKYQFTKSSDLLNFEVIDAEVSMNFHPRHGTVMQITGDEARRIVARWGITAPAGITGSKSSSVKPINIEIDTINNTVKLPVKYGTNLKKFDPELTAAPGTEISPAGKRNFKKGPAAYKVTAGDNAANWSVSAYIANNPVLTGLYADPEILYSEKTGRFYMYPTSDGFHEWSGWFFKVFSSDDLVNWTDEGVMLDFKTDVSWAERNAWAPCIVEKKIDGEYKYFYYFSAQQMIGVAVADSPTGPFKDSGKALINERPAGVRGGQNIDPDVFTDPVSGKSYLYWGNGYLGVYELNDDMVSVKKETLKVITPPRTFREGAYVIFRDGKYYVLWSENDTRDENYRVRYAFMESPTGPLVVPENNLILAKDASKGIYGTGHNSVIQVPGTDDWYIVYHRFNRPKGIGMGRSAGYNREVCIDKMEFAADGTILPVVPTLEGIEPVELKRKK